MKINDFGVTASATRKLRGEALDVRAVLYEIVASATHSHHGVYSFVLDAGFRLYVMANITPPNNSKPENIIRRFNAILCRLVELKMLTNGMKRNTNSTFYINPKMCIGYSLRLKRLASNRAGVEYAKIQNGELP